MVRAISFVTAFLLAQSPTFLHAEVRYVRAGDNLQAALNAARPGDELRLAAGATFSGNFVLPVTTGETYITVRSDLPDEGLPSPRQRVTPQTAARFARIQSPNGDAALRTAPGAHHWRLLFLEFPPTREGFGDIIQLGDGSSAQATLAQVPYELTLDRLYIHGDPAFGQKRGISLNARIVTIRNCYISEIKGVGMDTQAIGGWNGPGPFAIENNYLEAAGEVVLFGGSDPAIPNLVTEDVSFRYNYLTRPMSWRDGAVPAPANVSAVPTAGGSLPAGSYAYRVAARRSTGQGSTGSSTPTAEITAVASGAVTVTWAPVPGATGYTVFARNPAGVWQSWAVAEPSFVHNGATPGKSGNPPTAGTMWEIKNIFELKNARRVRIEHNLMENNWQAAQPGYAVLLTPRNQDGKCSWCVVEQISFSHNILRNVAGGINIAGYDSDAVSQQSNTIVIEENLIYDVVTRLGGPGWPFLVGDAVRDLTINRNSIDFDGTTLLYAWGGTKASPRAMPGFKFTNNAARHGEYGINGADASTGTLTLQMYFPGATVTGNWLSGGSSSRYPAGNRFEVPFDLKLTSATTSLASQGPGADVAKLMPLLESIPAGIMTGVPQSPRNLRIVSSGK
jgi:hypothetical protein